MGFTEISPMNHPTVGIVTRTKNRSVLLRRAIESVVHQSYPNWVMVIVNDGGKPDDVEFLVRHYQPVGERIHVIHNPVSLGMEGASKVGLEAVGAELLILHDDDDSWAPEFLSVAVNELLRVRERFPGTEGVTTYAHLVRETVRGNLIEIDSVEPFNGSVPRGFLSLDRMLAGNFIPPISFLFSRQAYRDVGSIYEVIPYLGDWDFLVRFLSRYDVYMIPQFLAFYHWRYGNEPGGFSNTVTAEVDQHRFYKQYLLNAWLREDFVSGKAGRGTYANLRMHVETLLQQPEAHRDRMVLDRDARLEAKDRELSELLDAVQHRDRMVLDRDARLEAKDRELSELLDAVQHRDQLILELESAAPPIAAPPPLTLEASPSELSQAILDYYWESLSWRVLRRFRRVANRLLRLPPERKPVVNSVKESWRIARDLQESWLWHAMAPLRWGGAVLLRLRRRISKRTQTGGGGL